MAFLVRGFVYLSQTERIKKIIFWNFHLPAIDRWSSLPRNPQINPYVIYIFCYFHLLASIKGDPVKRKISPVSFEKGFLLSGLFKTPPSLFAHPARFFTEGTERRIRTEHPYGLFTLNDPG